MTVHTVSPPAPGDQPPSSMSFYQLKARVRLQHSLLHAGLRIPHDCPCADVQTRTVAEVRRYFTLKDTECQPDAPSGTGSATSGVCVAPVLSVARTVMVRGPDVVACQGKLHNRQVSLE